VGQDGILRPIVNRPALRCSKSSKRPIANRPRDTIRPHFAPPSPYSCHSKPVGICTDKESGLAGLGRIERQLVGIVWSLCDGCLTDLGVLALERARQANRLPPTWLLSVDNRRWGRRFRLWQER
jgi:hypothetical protein